MMITMPIKNYNNNNNEIEDNCRNNARVNMHCPFPLNNNNDEIEDDGRNNAPSP